MRLVGGIDDGAGEHRGAVKIVNAAEVRNDGRDRLFLTSIPLTPAP